MYMIAVQEVWGRGGGGKPVMLLSNVLDTNGEEGVSPPTSGRDFLEIWVLNTGFFVCALLSLN